MMKKITLLLFTLLTVFSCTACGQARSESMGELMKRAGLNTVMGMGTVFLVLILISIIIYLLGFIGKAQKNKGAAAAAVPEKPAEPLVMETPAEPEDMTDDFELAAVIAAAIAASEGVPADCLVVRSIRRKASPNQWKNV